MLKIGELAERAGVNASKIRFFEKEGVFRAGQRQGNGYRLYPEEAVDRLRVLISAQAVGFTLAELKSLIPQTNGDADCWSHEQLEIAIEQKLEQIQALQQQLASNAATLQGILDDLRSPKQSDDCIGNAKRLLGVDDESTVKSQAS